MNAEVIQGDALETPTEVLHGLDICAGSGIGSWAFESAGISRTVCYVESDTYCQRVLQARMRSGDLSPAPIWDDLKTFNGRPWRGCVDFVYGGIPCQPYSVAGRRGGADDPRDLWPDLRRVLRDIQPRIVFLEQVPGFLVHAGGFRRVLGELAEDGYDAVWTVLSAAEVGAPHLRKRVWILAYPCSAGRREDAGSAYADEAEYAGRAALEADEFDGHGEGDRAGDVADAEGQSLGAGLRADGPRGERRGRSGDERGADPSAYPEGPGLERTIAARDSLAAGCPAESGPGRREADWWAVEPDVGRVAHGVASRVDRLRMLGNGWVPQCAIAAFLKLNRCRLSAQPPLLPT